MVAALAWALQSILVTTGGCPMSARVLRNLMATSLVTAFVIPLPIFWHQRQATELATCAGPVVSARPTPTMDRPARPRLLRT
jgi:hypothetical protein